MHSYTVTVYHPVASGCFAAYRIAADRVNLDNMTYDIKQTL